MNYQYELDYFFDTSKFEAQFDFIPSKPEDTIKEVVEKLNN